MNIVMAVLDGHDEPGVVAAAMATARLLGARSVVRRVAPEGDGRVEDIVHAMDRSDVVAVAISAGFADGLCWEVVARASKPVLVVPVVGRRARPRIERVLVPLDGDPRTAASVEDVVRLATAAGIEVHPLHVFDASTAPAFWDQAAHTHAAWEEEFRRRNMPGAKQVTLRHGDAADEVVDAAASERTDLIIIGWGRELADGRAHVVRKAVADGPAPVLLLGVQGR